MRHLIAFVLAVPLLLAGCQTTSSPGVVPVDPGAVVSTAQGTCRRCAGSFRMA
jgi:hypothetical protein